MNIKRLTLGFLAAGALALGTLQTLGQPVPVANYIVSSPPIAANYSEAAEPAASTAADVAKVLGDFGVHVNTTGLVQVLALVFILARVLLKYTPAGNGGPLATMLSHLALNIPNVPKAGEGRAESGERLGKLATPSGPPLSLILCVAASSALLLTGCYTVRKTTINTPAVYNVSTNASGLAMTNLVSVAKTETITERERLFVPKGYALFLEEDVYGISATLSGYSSTLPNVKAGFDHSSLRLIPTTTNQLYAASMSESGAMANKAVPFWMGINGQFTTGPQYVNQGADTNGNATMTSTAIVPAASVPK